MIRRTDGFDAGYDKYETRSRYMIMRIIAFQEPRPVGVVSDMLLFGLGKVSAVRRDSRLAAMSGRCRFRCVIVRRWGSVFSGANRTLKSQTRREGDCALGRRHL